MTLQLRHYRGRVRATPPRLIDLQAKPHEPTCKVHEVGSSNPHYCSCGLARSQALAGGRSHR